MPAIDRLAQLLNTASDVSSVLRRKEHYRFRAAPDSAFYLDVSGVIVNLFRGDSPQVEVDVQLQVPFAWRLATDQDDAGIYVVAQRRPLVGNAIAALTPFTGEAVFTIVLPRTMALILHLHDCRLTFEHLTGVYSFAGELPEASAAIGQLPAPVAEPLSSGKGRKTK